MNYVVYWIRLPNHNISNGYIGITCNIKQRLLRHKRGGTGKHIHNAINKYGWDNLVIDILTEGDLEFVLLVEEMLRPTEYIGWNLAKGGGLPCSKRLSGINNCKFKGTIVATCKSTGKTTKMNGKKEIVDNGFLPKHVYSCIKGKRKSHKGHTFYRLDKEKL